MYKRQVQELSMQEKSLYAYENYFIELQIEMLIIREDKSMYVLIPSHSFIATEGERVIYHSFIS